MCLPTQCYMCSNLSVVYRLPSVVLVTLLGMHRLGLLARYVALWLQYSHSYPIVGLQESDAALLKPAVASPFPAIALLRGKLLHSSGEVTQLLTIQGLHCFN